MSAMTNYMENKIVDWLLRAQALTPPAIFYVALFTTAPGETGGGVEVSGGAYARVAITGSLANWAGTQGPGTTAVSSGTGGQTSNNGVITFPAPTANWGSVTHWALFDAATGGNMWLFGTLTQPKNINSGDAAPAFPAGALTITAS